MNNRIIRRHHAGTIAATLPSSVAFDENGNAVQWHDTYRRAGIGFRAGRQSDALLMTAAARASPS
jgi:hypothetical protein